MDSPARQGIAGSAHGGQAQDIYLRSLRIARGSIDHRRKSSNKSVSLDYYDCYFDSYSPINSIIVWQPKCFHSLPSYYFNSTVLGVVAVAVVVIASLPSSIIS